MIINFIYIIISKQSSYTQHFNGLKKLNASSVINLLFSRLFYLVKLTEYHYNFRKFWIHIMLYIFFKNNSLCILYILFSDQSSNHLQIGEVHNTILIISWQARILFISPDKDQVQFFFVFHTMLCIYLLNPLTLNSFFLYT